MPLETLALDYADPARFKAYERNARVHTEEQLRQLQASITEFGFTNPLLVDEADEIIAGHGRQTVAIRMGLTEVPFIVLAGLSDEQKRALRVADNRLALNAGWDMELLAAELESLPEGMLAFTGFSDAELEQAFAYNAAVQGLTDPEDVPDTPAQPVSEIGDVWLMGEHRLCCGDATDPEDVKRLLGTRIPNLMVTDPPYGVDYDASWREGAGLNGPLAAHGKVTNDGFADWREAFVLFPGSIVYCWHAARYAALVQQSLEACGFTIRNQIIWEKNSLVIGRGDYHWQHEPCWYAVKKKGRWLGDRKQSTLWEIAKNQKSETGHSTQKPIDCMRRPMLNNSSPGELIYDPFMGSGTTLIAAAMEVRTALGMEIAPEYVDVGVKRWMNFAGAEARLEQTGETFTEVAQRRGRPLDAAGPVQEPDDVRRQA